MHGKYVERLQCHRIVAAKHVLIAQKVRKIRRQRLANARVIYGGNPAAAQFQSEQLARVEKLAVMLVAPAMQALRLVAGGNRVVRDEPRAHLAQPFRRLAEFRQVRGIRPFEEPPLATNRLRRARLAVIFQRVEPVLW